MQEEEQKSSSGEVCFCTYVYGEYTVLQALYMPVDVVKSILYSSAISKLFLELAAIKMEATC